MFKVDVAGMANFKEQLSREDILAGKYAHPFY